MDAQLLAIAHPNLVGYKVGNDYWIFSPSNFQPSYWLLLKREGFSAEMGGGSQELEFLTMFLGREEMETIYRVHDTPPDRWFEFGLRDDLEHLILSGSIKVFKVNEMTARRLANFHDTIYSNPTECTGNAFSNKRNELAEELAKDILVRWVGKDKSDKIHWDRWAVERALVEVYDDGVTVVDTVVDLVVGLWDIGKFVVSIVGSSIELTMDIAKASAQFQAKLVSGDLDGIKKDLKALGVAADEVMASAEVFKAKLELGYTMFTQLKEDPLTRELLLDYFSALYQSIPYRDSRTIGVRIVSEVGIEVLLALATAGAGNVARRAAQAGAQGAKALKATRIGPFTTKAIDLMADLTKALRQASSKSPEASDAKWVNGNRGWESQPAEPRRVESSPPKPKQETPEPTRSPEADNQPSANDQPEPTTGTQPGTNKNGDACSADKLTCTGGEPISLVTGEEILTLTDFTLNGPCPLTWERKYKSSHRDDIGLGHGWTHSFAEKLDCSDPQTLIYHTSEARLVPFSVPESGESVTHPTEKLVLTRHGSSHFSIRPSSGSGIIRHFHHEDGQSLRLSAVRNALGSGVSLTYDDQHRLTDIISDTGAQWTLSYRDTHITRIDRILADGTRRTLARYHYDDNNDLIQAGDTNEHAEHYAYHDHQIARRTLKSGYRFYFKWSDQTTSARCLRNWGDHVNGVRTYDYTFKWQSEKREVAITDTRGGVEHYRFNTLGLPVYHKNQEGGETQYEYDDHGNLIKTTNALGQVETREYDEQHQLVKIIDTQGKTLTFKRDGFGNIIESQDALGQPWQRSYTKNGLVKTQTNPLGETVTYEYNELGLPLAITNPMGESWRYLWDNQGQLTAIRNPQGQHVRYKYTLTGQVESIILPDGSRTDYHYNPGGQCIRIDTPDGQSQHFRYNGLGLMTEHEKANGRVTLYAYNGLSQVVRRTDSLGHELHYHYDGERNLVGLTNENGEHYQLKYDLNERLIEEIGFDGRIQRYDYNVLGHLTASEEYTHAGDRCLNRMRYERDQQGRLLEQWLEVENGEATSECLKRFEYDGAGRLIAAANAYRHLEWEYDKAGRMTQVDQDGQVICHEYDVLGRRIRSALPGGEQLDYQWDSAGHTQAIHFDGQQIAGFTRDSMGREIERQHGNQLRTRQNYDPQGRLLEQRLFKASSAFNEHSQDTISARQYHYNNGGQLSRIDDQRRGTTQYHYDAIDRLIQVQGPQPETFVHDPAGNLLSSSETAGIDLSPQDEATPSNQVTNNRLNFYGDSHYSYDDNGNRTHTRRGKDQKLVTHYSYDSLNQLVTVNNNGEITEYQYDALGRRIAKHSRGKKTTFLWNDDVLLSETHYQNGKQAQHKTYVFEPGTFKPLAFVQNQAIYHYHLDHLGTPQEITDTQGDIVWSAQYRAYGNLALADVEQVENNLRFQGQYFDEESGLHYNRFRYYDPGCGRFINQDPIGLLGGSNNYRYVPNPVTWIDPFGLSCKEGGPTGKSYSLTKEMDSEYEGEHLPNSEQWGFMGGQVKYLSEVERAEYELFVKDGNLITSNGQLFDSFNTMGTGNGKAIYVMDPQGRIYASNSPMVGEFHHSSFLSGGKVSAAGEIEVINGKIVGINNTSGHYKPEAKYIDQFTSELSDRGADLSNAYIEKF